MKQLSFQWPAQVSLAAEDYFVSQSNSAAFKMVSTPSLWPNGKLVVVGPEGSGKSHLVRIFSNANLACTWQAGKIDPKHPMPTTAMVIENMEDLLPEAEEWLFHAHNTLAGRAPILLTARSEPARWNIGLRDLASRMQAITPVHIGAPDDNLMTAVLMKLFNDRQLAPDPDLAPYLATRLERSLPTVATAVEHLDRLALDLRRPLNRRLASDWLCGRI